MNIGTTAPSAGDLAIGAVAAGLELVAVNTYAAALAAAGAGSIGEVPPAVAEFVTTVQGHHQAALDAWNAVLTAGGQAAVTAPPAGLEATVNEMFATVTDVVGAAELALMLEEIAAATYLDAIGKLESGAAIALAGSIQPIDRQHIAVLLFVLGRYPVPDTFATADMAFAGEGESASNTIPAAAASSISIVDFAFDPDGLEIAVGTTVEWVNNDAFDHSVVADDGTFTSETIEPGGTFAFEFTAPGTFPYKCGIHPQMIASITVTE